MALDELQHIDGQTDIRVVQQTTVEQMVEKILGERLKFNKERKLTWNEQTRPKTPGDKRVGTEGLNRRLEYSQFGRSRYFVQNGKIYNGAGKRITLKEVDPVWQPFVEEGYENHKKQALAADDSLCPRCLESGETFVASSHENYMDHNLDKHPDIVSSRMHRLDPPKADKTVNFADVVERVDSSPEVKAAEAVTAPVVATIAPKEVGNFLCSPCGRMFKNEHGLRIHTSRVHKA